MFYNFVKLVEILLIARIAAREQVTQDSTMFFTQLPIDNSTLFWKSDILIELSTKDKQVPMLLLMKKTINPSFSFNEINGTYDYDADYNDFEAWSRNQTSSLITLPKSKLKDGDVWNIGVYSEYLPVTYWITNSTKNETVDCYPECSKNAKECKNGSCYCDSREYLGRLCDTHLNETKDGENKTVTLKSDNWSFFYYDTWGKDYTIKLDRRLGEPELYFQNLSKNSNIKGYLPGVFANNFTLAFKKNDTIKKGVENDIDYLMYGVHCPKIDDNCTFSIIIERKSSDSSSFIATWLVPLCVCVGLPFLGLVFCVCRKGCKQVKEENEARIVKEKERCLTGFEMDDYFPEMQWAIFGKEFSICSFCSMAFENWEKARMLNCKHIFHLKCIDRWCESNGSCPVCKQKLIQDKDQSVEDSTPSRGSSDKKSNDQNNPAEVVNSSKPIDQKEIVLLEKQVKDKKIDEVKDQENGGKQIKGETGNSVSNSKEFKEQEEKKAIEFDKKVENENKVENEKNATNINKRIPIFKSKESESDSDSESDSESEIANEKK